MNANILDPYCLLVLQLFDASNPFYLLVLQLSIASSFFSWIDLNLWAFMEMNFTL